MDREDIYLLGCLFAIHQLQTKGSSSFAYKDNGKWIIISWDEICTWIEKQYGIETSQTERAEESEVILTKKEYGELVSNEFENGYAKGYREALEQEPVLDKVRAEIDQLPTNTRINWDGCCPDIDYPEIEYVDVSKKQLLNILDKYMTESE